MSSSFFVCVPACPVGMIAPIQLEMGRLPHTKQAAPVVSPVGRAQGHRAKLLLAAIWCLLLKINREGTIRKRTGPKMRRGPGSNGSQPSAMQHPASGCMQPDKWAIQEGAWIDGKGANTKKRRGQDQEKTKTKTKALARPSSGVLPSAAPSKVPGAEDRPGLPGLRRSGVCPSSVFSYGAAAPQAASAFILGRTLVRGCPANTNTETKQLHWHGSRRFTRSFVVYSWPCARARCSGTLLMSIDREYGHPQPALWALA